jgi:hypothetical protein
MDKELCVYISEHAVLEITYGDEKRTVEAYLLGRDNEGNTVFRAYQTSGIEGWQTFDLNEITGEIRNTGRYGRLRDGFYQHPDDISDVMCVAAEIPGTD